MELSSMMCRAQEALHRDRATNAALENVRSVAIKASAAWGNEALAAERRETRRNRMPAPVAPQEPHSVNEEVRQYSENPDRGFADA
ncbi:hypothetical protein FHS98_003710 [Sphingomonas oligoaromativorans]|nr:hypothetical protein [Sphingomonas oligoaromativorans]